ncbi:hypothetical protein EDB85DRAFT_1863945, partial [Lactarius pseudohatsudake]
LVSPAPLRSSDRRKFKARTTERFQLAPEIADALMPDGLLVQMFSAYNGDPNVFYMSGNGHPLWFSVGKACVRMLSSPSRILTYIDRSILWKHPTLLPVLTTPAAVILVLVGGADLMVPGVVQVPAHALASALVSVAQFVRDSRGPPLAVGRMAVDADKINNNSANKGKAVVVLHSWKDHRWALGSKCGPPDALPMVAAAAGGEAMGGAGDDSDGVDSNGGGADRCRHTAARRGPGAHGKCSRHDAGRRRRDVSTRLRVALLKALRTSLVALPNSAFPMPMTTLYTAHILPARPFSRTATTPVDIKHSTFKSLPAFLRASDEGGLPKLMDARPDVQVSAVSPAHVAVIAHEQLGRKTSGDDMRRGEKRSKPRMRRRLP